MNKEPTNEEMILQYIKNIQKEIIKLEERKNAIDKAVQKRLDEVNVIIKVPSPRRKRCKSTATTSKKIFDDTEGSKPQKIHSKPPIQQVNKIIGNQPKKQQEQKVENDIKKKRAQSAKRSKRYFIPKTTPA